MNTFEFIKLGFRLEGTTSKQKIRECNFDILQCAFNCQMKFEKDDIIKIIDEFGSWWLGCNNNGYGSGNGLYNLAIISGNTSAMIACENYLGIKPFLINKKRFPLFRGNGEMLVLDDTEYSFTGFIDGDITIVTYQKSKRRNLRFTNKQWRYFIKKILSPIRRIERRI